jgi:hypothetical protein
LTIDESEFNLLRIILLDKDWVKRIFTTLRQFYRNTPYLTPLLNILEASVLNSITERNLFINLIESALKADKDRDQALTDLQDEIHKVDNKVKTLKEHDVLDIIKKYLEGRQ